MKNTLKDPKTWKLTGSVVGVLLLIVCARVWYHSESSTAQPYLDDEPEQEQVEPEQTEVAAVPTDQPSAAEPNSAAKIQANLAWSALRRHTLAYAWELSKLPKDELNDYCWTNRPELQALKDQFNGGASIKPSEFLGNEPLLLKDVACRMAAHYQQTGDAPEWASTDISTLEGMPDEWKAE